MSAQSPRAEPTCERALPGLAQSFRVFCDLAVLVLGEFYGHRTDPVGRTVGL